MNYEKRVLLKKGEWETLRGRNRKHWWGTSTLFYPSDDNDENPGEQGDLGQLESYYRNWL